MFCKFCRDCKLSVNFNAGTQNFQKSALTRHLATKEHRQAVLQVQQQGDMTIAIQRDFSEKETALLSALRTVYFMVKQDIPTHKYEQFLDFL